MRRHPALSFIAQKESSTAWQQTVWAQLTPPPSKLPSKLKMNFWANFFFQFMKVSRASRFRNLQKYKIFHILVNPKLYKLRDNWVYRQSVSLTALGTQ